MKEYLATSVGNGRNNTFSEFLGDTSRNKMDMADCGSRYALKGHTQSELSRRIRKVAIERGGIEIDRVKPT